MQFSTDILKQHFEFHQIFDLQTYDSNMQNLYHALLPLIQGSYDQNYRFIFKLDDTQYHTRIDQPGLTLKNLQSLTSALDISNYFCLIMTRSHIQEQLLSLQKETTDVHAISSIKNCVGRFPQSFLGINAALNVDKISRTFVSLNGQQRTHRMIWMALLNHHGLLDQGIVSYATTAHPEPNSEYTSLKNQPVVPSDLIFLYPQPFTRINDNILIKDSALRNIITQSCINGPFRNFHDTHGRHTDAAVDLLQQAFVNVVTETICHYPGHYVSEKTFKPIATLRPFLLIASKNSLRELQQMGFKTFDAWWDEGYDQLDDPMDRITAVLTIINDLAHRPISELRAICSDMWHVLDHNYKYYQNVFFANEIKEIEQCCRSNLDRHPRVPDIKLTC